MCTDNHYCDNQGFCHMCGKPMDAYYFKLTTGSEEEWTEIVKQWNIDHPDDKVFNQNTH